MNQPHMLVLTAVSKQVMGLVSLTPPSFEAGIPPRVLSITGGEATMHLYLLIARSCLPIWALQCDLEGSIEFW